MMLWVPAFAGTSDGFCCHDAIRQRPVSTISAFWRWSAPARWAAPCWKAGSRSVSIRTMWWWSSRSRRRNWSRWNRRAWCSIRPRARCRISATIVLAVKPQVAADVLPAVAAMAGPGTLVLSIMAGKTLGFLQSGLPKAAIVRAMPNTPAAIGRGITVAVPNAAVTAEQKIAGAASAGGFRRGRMDFGREPDGCGDRRFRLGPGLRFPAGGDADAGRHRGGVAAGAGGEARARDGRGRRRIAASLAARSRHLAQERDFAGRDDGRGARGADGGGRARSADAEGGGWPRQNARANWPVNPAWRGHGTAAFGALHCRYSPSRRSSWPMPPIARKSSRRC